jgi:hypothetical protein
MSTEPRPKLRDILRGESQPWNETVKTDAHAFNKTMLAKFGFADDDRKHDLHDHACRFLVQRDVALKLASAFYPGTAKQVPCRYELSCDSPACIKKDSWGNIRLYSWTAEWEEKFVGFNLWKARNEVLLSKGHGQYQTTIGFVDVVLQVRPVYEVIKVPQCPQCGAPAKDLEEHRYWGGSYGIAIEVKAGRCQISEAIRQIGLFRQYLPDSTSDIWALATPWEVTKSEGAFLAQEQIKHVLLGAEFAKFVEDMRDPPKAVSDVTL